MWFNYNMIDVSDDLYALLEVSPDATQEEIKKAYYKAAKKYHPDVYHAPDSEQRFQKINYAYETLKNPLQRATYDSFLNTIKTAKSKNDEKPKVKHTDNFYHVDIDNNFYVELDLKLFADLEEIKKAYKILTEKYNPSNSLVPNAREKTKRITYAYTILSDPNLKERYDYLLRILVKFNYRSEFYQNKTSSTSANKQYPGTSSANGTKENESREKTSGVKSSYTTSGQSSNSSKDENSSYNNTYHTNAQKNNKEENSKPNNYEYSSENKSSNGCRKIFICFIICVILFYLLSTCSNKKTSTPNQSYTNYESTSSVRKTVKPTDSVSSSMSIFTKRYYEIEIGKTTYLEYRLPDSRNYTYDYDPFYIEVIGQNNRISVKGVKTGVTFIKIYNDNDQVVDKCTIVIKTPQKPSTTPKATVISYTRTPKPTATKKVPPVSEWSFEKQKIDIRVGESIELHFSTPPYAVFTYIPEKYGLFTTTYKNSNTVIITGVKSGTGLLYLRNDRDEIVAECRINVSGKSTVSHTPTPLAGKQGGYTEQELIENGYVGTKKSDGSMFYPGFYQAPNGNYYPTGN